MSHAAIVLNILMVTMLLPYTLTALRRGEQPPDTGWAAPYFKAEPRLFALGKWFIVFVCLHALVKLVLHFDLLSPSQAESIKFVFGAPFILLAFVSLGMWIRTWLQLRRSAARGAP